MDIWVPLKEKEKREDKTKNKQKEGQQTGRTWGTKFEREKKKIFFFFSLIFLRFTEI